MKKLLTLLFLSCALVGNAQKVESGSVAFLRNEEKINLVLDFDNCLIDKTPAKIKKEREENWDKGVKEVIDRFTTGYGEKIHHTLVGVYPDANYTMVYHIDNIDDDQDTKGYITVMDSKTKEEKAVIMKCNGSAGSFGSFFNLFGDAMENLGEKVAKLVKKGE